MLTIEASFDNVDLAELAIGRLRRSIPGLDLEYGSAGAWVPADSPYTAAVLYPAGPTDPEHGSVSMGQTRLGSRVLFTGEILGLPVYRSGGAELKLRVPEEVAQRAGAMLINAGARGVRTRERQEARQ
jgi:hypothetical protein